MENRTITKIDSILGRIHTHPEYSKCAGREAYAVLREEAQKHSYLIEEEAEKRRVSKREKRQIQDNLNEGWNLLAKGGITIGTLATLGHVVEPEGHPYKNFRQSDVTFGPFLGADFHKIPYEMNTLVDRLNEGNLHPVIRATESHIEIVRIHPFLDGNGRSARLLQNFTLQQRGYPSAVIPVQDRELYINMLQRTIADRNAGKSNLHDPQEAESLFKEYLSARILESVTKVEEELMRSRSYEVVLEGLNDRSAIMRCANSLKDLARRTGSGGVKVSIDKQNGNKRSATLQIMGDLSLDDVNRNLQRTSSRCGKFSFKIKSKGC